MFRRLVLAGMAVGALITAGALFANVGPTATLATGSGSGSGSAHLLANVAGSTRPGTSGRLRWGPGGRRGHVGFGRVLAVTGVSGDTITATGRRGKHHVLHGTSETDVHLPKIGIERAEIPGSVGMDLDSCVGELEAPGLGVVRVGGEDAGAHQRERPLIRAPVPPRLGGRTLADGEHAFAIAPPGARPIWATQTHRVACRKKFSVFGHARRRVICKDAVYTAHKLNLR